MKKMHKKAHVFFKSTPYKACANVNKAVGRGLSHFLFDDE